MVSFGFDLVEAIPTRSVSEEAGRTSLTPRVVIQVSAGASTSHLFPDFLDDDVGVGVDVDASGDRQALANNVFGRKVTVLF